MPSDMNSTPAKQLPSSVNVFVVHSGVTWAIASLLCKEELAGDLNIVAFRRGSWSLDGLPSLEIMAVGCGPQSLLNARRVRKSLWNSLDSLTGGLDFELFVPHLQRFEYRLLAAHPKCIGVTYIEEGDIAYSGSKPSYRQNWGAKVRAVITFGFDLRALNSSLRSKEFFPESEARRFICLSGAAFPWAPWRYELDLGELEDSAWTSDAPIVVVDYVVHERGVDQMIERVLACLRSEMFDEGRASEVILKFHPSTSKKLRSYFIDSLSRESMVRIALLDDDFVLESLPPDTVCLVGASSAKRYLLMRSARVLSF